MPGQSRELNAEPDAPTTERARRRGVADAAPTVGAAPGVTELPASRRSIRALIDASGASDGAMRRASWHAPQLLALQRTAGNRAVQRLTGLDRPLERVAAGPATADAQLRPGDADTDAGELAPISESASRDVQRNGDDDEEGSPVKGVAPPSLEPVDDESDEEQEAPGPFSLSLGPLGDDEEEEDEVEVVRLNWDNAAVTFNTANDRYTVEPKSFTGTKKIWTYRGGTAAQAEVALTEDEPVHLVSGDNEFYLTTKELADLLTTDSTYTVTASGYTRYAPVNLIVAPEQVNFAETRQFCYLPSGSGVATAVKKSSDSDVFVTGVEGGSVVLSIKGVTHRAPIQPSVGDIPFDFDLASDGSISSGHMGHAVYNLA